MAQFATDTDLLEYVPDVKKYGIQEFLTEHEKTYDDIIRLLNVRWWPTTGFARYDVSVLGGSEKLSPSRLNSDQFTRAAVYHVLAYYIYPKLSTFEPDGDSFREQMTFYKNKFDEEFDLILKDGVHYDLDSSGSYTDSEKQSFYKGRLIR
jgi:hypothetical protein